MRKKTVVTVALVALLSVGTAGASHAANSTVVDEYDTNGEAGIQQDELANAFVDYLTSSGVTMIELRTLVGVYFETLIGGLSISG